MTTLICSGTLFSDWRNILKKYLPADSEKLFAHAEISVLAKEICHQQFPGLDELDRNPFTPDNAYADIASSLLSSIEKEPLSTWDDNNCSLYLNFLKTTAEKAMTKPCTRAAEFSIVTGILLLL